MENSMNWQPRFFLLLISAILTANFGVVRAQGPPLYLDDKAPIAARVNDLLSRLTLQEKVSLVHANGIFSVAGVPRLGIPELIMDDGPLGVRADVGNDFVPLGHTNDFATAMPATLGLAATWDTNLAHEFGAVIGQEAVQRGKDIIFGPAVNIQRTPLDGRNEEYMGEDPFLAAQMAVDYIEGEQAQGVSSCVKHFAANNQENTRFRVNEIIDERTLHEIYLPAFRAAMVKADVFSIMVAYNKINGQYCSENTHLLRDILRNQWGFKGIAVSDYGAVHHTDLAVLDGLDIENGLRPDSEPFYLGKPFLNGLQDGEFPVAVLDDMVRHHLYVMFKLHLIYDPSNPPAPKPVPTVSPSTPAHQEIAEKIAEASFVLLKNEKNFLPLDVAHAGTIAVIGGNATAKFCDTGGAPMIKPPFEVTALEGIGNYVTGRAKIIYAEGYYPPGDWGVQYLPDGKRATAADSARLAQQAVAAAKSADMVIYVGGLNRMDGFDHEGADRKSLKLPCGQDELLAKIVRANPKTVVVLIGGGAVEMSQDWLSRVPVLLYIWYPGMEGGNALAQVLFGNVNPSGKLSCTFPKRLADTPTAVFGPSAYPGTNGAVNYEEGLLVGYRWYDAKHVEPLFPFGFGLSYTHFAYSHLHLVPDGAPTGLPLKVEFELANTGERAGAEVAEIYVEPVDPPVFRPVRELKGFAKVFLQPGETKQVSVTLGEKDFAYYDVGTRCWVAAQGNYRIRVGRSSRDFPLTADFTLPHTIYRPDRVRLAEAQAQPASKTASLNSRVNLLPDNPKTQFSVR